MGGETPSAVGSGCCRSKQDKKTTLSQYDHPSTAQNPRISSQCGDTVEGNQLSRNPRIPRGAAWPARSSPPRLGRQAVCLSAMIRDLTGLPSKPRRPRRPGPRRRSLVRSRIRNAGQSDIGVSRRTRLAGPDPEFAVLVCRPSFSSPSRRNLIFDPTAPHRVSPALVQRTAGHSILNGAGPPIARGSARPHSRPWSAGLLPPDY